MLFSKLKYRKLKINPKPNKYPCSMENQKIEHAISAISLYRGIKIWEK